MLKLCKLSCVYKFVKIRLKLWNATEIAQYWSKNDYILASWEDHSESWYSAGYYHSCHTTVQAAKAAQKRYGRIVFHRPQVIFCHKKEF